MSIAAHLEQHTLVDKLLAIPCPAFDLFWSLYHKQV